MTILLTGAAGFIGYHCTQALLARGEQVYGIDNLNDYYDVKLKEARLAKLKAHKNFRFQQMNIADTAAMEKLRSELKDADRILHLAAQAGVRYSLKNPHVYVDSNVHGQLNLLEMARNMPQLKHFVYASSSSVYGGNTKVPFSVQDPVNLPISLYAATKRSCELMAQTYTHLFKIPATGLRFFTVYGPWGRPDMAAYLFTRDILAGKPIPVFNNGNMSRDFTYIDDIVAGVLAALDKVPTDTPPHRVYNLGNSHPEKLTDFIGALEAAIGKKAEYNFMPMQQGDVPATFADISESTRDLGFKPVISIAEGIPRFVAWFREYHQV